MMRMIASLVIAAVDPVLTVTVTVACADPSHAYAPRQTRYNAARRRDEPRWEIVWSRVKLHLVWDRQLRPEEPEAQLYASWKYPRSALNPSCGPIGR